MKDFMEKWNSEPKFKTKVKLSLYTLFVVFVSIFAITNNDSVPTNKLQEATQQTNKNNNDSNEKDIIKIPDKYNYKFNITINESQYTYIGKKEKNKENIKKEVDTVITNYIYENNNYYIQINENYILTSKEDVYDVVDYNYLKLETINEYISNSTKNGNQYIVYLKDIVLENDSENYIIITLNNNKINIDYTELLQIFDKAIDKCLVKIEIEEIE